MKVAEWQAMAQIGETVNLKVAVHWGGKVVHFTQGRGNGGLCGHRNISSGSAGLFRTSKASQDGPYYMELIIKSLGLKQKIVKPTK